MYTIKDFGSLHFTECTSVMIDRAVFQFITIHEHQKWLITTSRLKSDQHQFSLNNISAKKRKDHEN